MPIITASIISSPKRLRSCLLPICERLSSELFRCTRLHSCNLCSWFNHFFTGLCAISYLHLYLLLVGRMKPTLGYAPKVYFDFNDWWIGYYRGPNHHYVCLLPTVVI